MARFNILKNLYFVIYFSFLCISPIFTSGAHAFASENTEKVIDAFIYSKDTFPVTNFKTFDQITFAYGVGYMNRPNRYNSYKVTVSGNGNVEFEGRFYNLKVKRTEVISKKYQLEEVQIHALIKLINTSSYINIPFDLYNTGKRTWCESYEASHHSPSIVTSVTINQTRHEVRHYLLNLDRLNCSNDPKQLLGFEKDFLAITQIDQLMKTDESSAE